jgi:hypothetical protein
VVGLIALVTSGGVVDLAGTCMVIGNCILNTLECIYPLWSSMASFIWTTMDGNPKIVLVARLSLSANWIFTWLPLWKSGVQ